MLYSSFPLAICVAHGSLYISKLLSQFILPSPSPPGQQVHFLHLCLCSLPASRFTSTIFLGPMYMHSYATLLLLFLTSLWVTGSRFVHLSSVDSNFPFLWLSNIRCMHVPQLLYPSMCWWPSRLLPGPGCCRRRAGDIGEQASLLHLSGFDSHGPLRMIVPPCSVGGPGAGTDLVSGWRWEMQEKD